MKIFFAHTSKLDWGSTKTLQLKSKYQLFFIFHFQLKIRSYLLVGLKRPVRGLVTRHFKIVWYSLIDETLVLFGLITRLSLQLGPFGWFWNFLRLPNHDFAACIPIDCAAFSPPQQGWIISPAVKLKEQQFLCNKKILNI